jgi:RNA polymerase primary sigma factor
MTLNDSLNWLSVKKFKPLSKKELNDLILEYQKTKCKKTLEKILYANLKLVRYIINKYYRSLVHDSYYTDLFQCGCIGLIDAVDKFKVSKGYSFSTYAFSAIKRKILRGIQDLPKTIRLPNYIYSLNSNYIKIKKEYYEKGIEVNDDILAGKLKISKEDLKRNKNYLNNDTESLENLNGILYTDENYDNVDYNNYLNSIISKILAKLTQKERDIIKLRYGIGCEPLNYTSIAKKYNVCIERIRQIENRAFSKLKKICRHYRVASYTKLEEILFQ